MKFTILAEIDTEAQAQIDKHMMYNAKYDTGFAEVTAPDRDTAQALIAEAMDKLQGMKERGEYSTTKPNPDRETEADSITDEIRRRTAAFEAEPKGQKVVSGTKKGLQLAEKFPRSGLYGSEMYYLRDRILLDTFSGIGACYHLGMMRGYNLGQRQAKQKHNTM